MPYRPGGIPGAFRTSLRHVLYNLLGPSLVLCLLLRSFALVRPRLQLSYARRDIAATHSGPRDHPPLSHPQITRSRAGPNKEKTKGTALSCVNCKLVLLTVLATAAAAVVCLRAVPPRRKPWRVPHLRGKMSSGTVIYIRPLPRITNSQPSSPLCLLPM